MLLSYSHLWLIDWTHPLIIIYVPHNKSSYIFPFLPITRSSRKQQKKKTQKKKNDFSFASFVCAEMHLIHMSCVKKKKKHSWQNMRNDISDINSLAFSVHLILLIGWNRLFTIISFMSFVLLFYSFIFLIFLVNSRWLWFVGFAWVGFRSRGGLWSLFG